MKILALSLLISLSALAQADDFQSKYAVGISDHLFKALQLQVEARNVGEGMCLYYKSSLVQQAQKLAEDFSYGTNNVERLKTDKAIQAELGDSLAFKMALSDSEKHFPYSGIEKTIIGVRLWGPAPGVFGNVSSLHFTSATTVKVGKLLLPENFSPEWSYTEKPYSIRRENSQLIIRIDSTDHILSHYIGEDSLYNAATPEWNLVPAKTPNANPYMEGFVDSESECEA